jgi:hypothetical protein
MNDIETQEDDYGFFYDLEDYDHNKVYHKKDKSYNIQFIKKEDDNYDYESEKKFHQRINRYAIVIGLVINLAIIFVIWR